MACQMLKNTDPSAWLFDSGCTNHMTKHQIVFTHLDESDQPKVRLGNSDIVQAKGRGTIQVNTKRGIKTMF